MARTRPEDVADVADVDLTGKTILVTGGTDGIGRETAISLGRLGAEILVHGRDQAKADAVVESIEMAGGTAVSILADFVSEAQVHHVADAVLDKGSSLDVLINNAGATFANGSLNDAGVERTMAVNHLAPFVLTNRLAPALEDDGGRIITVGSQVHQRVGPDWVATESVDGYDAFKAYGRSKLANVVFTYALDRQLESATTNCLHPGFVPGTALWRGGNPLIKWGMRAVGALPHFIQNVLGKTPDRAAATPVYLAASPAVESVSGTYYADLEPSRSARVTYDQDVQRDLWEWSLSHVDIEDPIWDPTD